MFKRAESKVRRLSEMSKKEFYANYYGELVQEGMVEVEEVTTLLTLQKELGFFSEKEFNFIKERLENELS